jgi:hypothetical protein
MSAVTATSLECLVHLPARAWAMVVVVVVVVVVGKHRRDPALVLVSPRISVAYCTEQSHHHPSEYYHRPHSCTHTHYGWSFITTTNAPLPSTHTPESIEITVPSCI